MQIRDSIDVADACRSYFSQLFPLNPGGIVPSGPTLEDLNLDPMAEAPQIPVHCFMGKP